MAQASFCSNADNCAQLRRTVWRWRARGVRFLPRRKRGQRARGDEHLHGSREGIFERDACLTMEIVANNDQLVFLNGSTDPYSNGSGGAMLGQNINTCNSVIGSANYDIGHVFSTGGGGVAYLQSPCGGNKAGGVTGQGAPIGDPFDVDYVAHEMGHQYGGNHTKTTAATEQARPRSSQVPRPPSWGTPAFARPICKATQTTISTTTASTR